MAVKLVAAAYNQLGTTGSCPSDEELVLAAAAAFPCDTQAS